MILFLCKPSLSLSLSLFVLAFISEAEEKGSDCIPQFRAMQECFEKYPEEYGKYADSDDDSEETEGGGGGGGGGSDDGGKEQKVEGRTEKGGEGEGAAAKDQGGEGAKSEKATTTEGEQTTATAEASTAKS